MNPKLQTPLSPPPNIIADVLEFISISQPEMINMPGRVVPKATLELAYKLIHEEVNEELLPRIQSLIDGKNSIEIMANLLDDAVDSVYVIAWTTIVLNLPFYAAWREVQRANMSKFPIHKNEEEALKDRPEVNDDEVGFATMRLDINSQRTVYKNPNTGKVMKPKSWKEPNVWGILYKQWTAFTLQNDPSIIVEKGGKYDIEDYMKDAEGRN